MPPDERCALIREKENGAEDGTRTRDPHLGKVMLYQLSHFRSMTDQVVGAESQIRTGDTAIFSRVLYQLSYLGPDPGPRGGPSARRRIARSPNEQQPRGTRRSVLVQPDGRAATDLCACGAAPRPRRPGLARGA